MDVVYFSIIPTFEPSRYCKCWIVCFYDKKNIEITFDFDDCYQTLLNQLPAMGVDTVVDDDNNLQVKVKEVV